MKVLFILISTLLIWSTELQAQDKKGCNPKACSPGNTKMEEALVVTNLRTEVEEIKSSLKRQGLVNESKIAAGSNEEESLLIIAQEINQIQERLGQSTTDFSKQRGAQLVKSLTNELESIR